jgi:hypothetical protein
MARVLALAAMLLLALSESAFAQLKIETVLANGPIDLASKLELQFSKLGQSVLVSANGAVALQNAQAVINAALPAINQKLTCASGSSYGATIGSLTPNTPLIGQSQTLDLAAEANVFGCKILTLKGGDVTITTTIEPVIQNSILQLRVKNTRVQQSGIILASWFSAPVPNSLVNAIVAFITPKISKYALDPLNGWLTKQFQNAALQKEIKAYDLQFQSAQLNFQGANLTVTVGLSGQVPTATVDRLLGF